MYVQIYKNMYLYRMIMYVLCEYPNLINSTYNCKKRDKLNLHTPCSIVIDNCLIITDMR